MDFTKPSDLFCRLAGKKADRSIDPDNRSKDQLYSKTNNLSSRKTGFYTHFRNSHENHTDKSVPGKNILF